MTVTPTREWSGATPRVAPGSYARAPASLRGTGARLFAIVSRRAAQGERASPALPDPSEGGQPGGLVCLELSALAEKVYELILLYDHL